MKINGLDVYIGVKGFLVVYNRASFEVDNVEMTRK